MHLPVPNYLLLKSACNASLNGPLKKPGSPFVRISALLNTRRKGGLGKNLGKKNPDGAQNRGGSRPLVETQQYLEAKHGPGKGTIINAFSCMEAGLKNCDANGNAGPIPEQAKKLDGYNEALQEKYPENWQEQPFDGQIAYNIGGGMLHGCLAIGNGVVNKATIIDAANVQKGDA